MRARSRRKRRVPREGKIEGIVLTDLIRLKDLRRIRVCRKVRFPVYRQLRTKASDITGTAVQQAGGGEDLKQGSGNIIIYTHATESYLPAAASNAHTTELKSTVREAGETLTSRLKLHGFSVVHDMTLHDYPSYNKSYNRSLETVKKLCASYSNKKLVIDLHRDATSSGKRQDSYDRAGKMWRRSAACGGGYAKYDDGHCGKITTTANKNVSGICETDRRKNRISLTNTSRFLYPS